MPVSYALLPSAREGLLTQPTAGLGSRELAFVLGFVGCARRGSLTRPPTEPNLGRKQMKVARGFWDARVKVGLTREALDTFVRALGTGTGTDGQEDGAMVCAGMEGITNTF